MLQLQELNCLLDFLKNHWLHVNMPDIFPLLFQLLLFLLPARSEVSLGLPPAPCKSRGECVPWITKQVDFLFLILEIPYAGFGIDGAITP